MVRTGDASTVGAAITAFVRELLGEHYALDVRELVPVDAGADRAASLWRACGHDGREYAVKWTAGGSPAGSVLSSALATACPGAAPTPVRTRTGALWADAGGRRLSVVEWVAGRSAVDVDPEEGHWVAYGRLLAALHDLPVDGELRRWLPREDFAPSYWVDVFDGVDARLTRAAGSTEDDCLTRLRAVWRQRRAELRVVRDGTLREGERFASRADDLNAVPCHADPHPGNLVVTGADTVALIDFDDAVLAPPERDLMFVLGGGVFAERLVTQRQQEAFLRGYGPHAVDERLLAYYRGLRVLEDVSDPATVVFDPEASPAERVVNLGYVTATLAPGALLDQALRSG